MLKSEYVILIDALYDKVYNIKNNIINIPDDNTILNGFYSAAQSAYSLLNGLSIRKLVRIENIINE